AWLVVKEWRAPGAPPPRGGVLLPVGALVGGAVIGAGRAYADPSGLHRTAARARAGVSPPPRGGAAPVTPPPPPPAPPPPFPLPFVAIRVVAGDRQSGALKIELQHPLSAFARMSAKAVVLLAGWLIASAPPLIAIVMWRAYGGSLYAPELLTVAAGHVLNAG